MIKITDCCSIAIYLLPLLAHFPLAFRKIWGPFNEVCIFKGGKKKQLLVCMDNGVVLGIGLLSVKCFIFEAMLPVSTGCTDSKAF